MSIKHPKIRLALRLVIVLMFVLIVKNSMDDHQHHKERLRKVAALNELKAVETASEKTLQVVKR